MQVRRAVLGKSIDEMQVVIVLLGIFDLHIVAKLLISMEIQVH